MDSDADPDGLIDRYSGTDQIDKLRYVTGWNSKLLLSALSRLLEAREWKDNMEALVTDMSTLAVSTMCFRGMTGT